jgi:hypothetical protein
MIQWTRRDCWVAVFDILGFKQLACAADKELPRAVLASQIEDILAEIEKVNGLFGGALKYLVISDTIILFTSGLEPEKYPEILQVCKALIEKSIYIHLPMRGAISVGTMFTCEDPCVFVGPAFIEAYEYCVDQDWIGLLLTPSVSEALKEVKIDPLRHDFVSDDIPLRNKETRNVFAYRLQRGRANYDSPFLLHLRDMQNGYRCTRKEDKEKYEKTINFVNKYYKRLEFSEIKG